MTMSTIASAVKLDEDQKKKLIKEILMMTSSSTVKILPYKVKS